MLCNSKQDGQKKAQEDGPSSCTTYSQQIFIHLPLNFPGRIYPSFNDFFVVVCAFILSWTDSFPCHFLIMFIRKCMYSFVLSFTFLLHSLSVPLGCFWQRVSYTYSIFTATALYSILPWVALFLDHNCCVSWVRFLHKHTLVIIPVVIGNN